jgi:hypothetical protein
MPAFRQQARTLRDPERPSCDDEGLRRLCEDAEIAPETWRDGILEAFQRAAVWGSTDRILRELEARREAFGEFELCTAFRYGGTPYELSENSMRL